MSFLRYGAWLRQAHGVKPQDIVAMDFENSDIFVFLWMGIWSIGAKPAFMNYNLSGPTLTHCVKTSNASLLLVDPNVASNVTDDVRKDLSHVRIVELNPGLEREILSTEPQRRPDSERTEEFGHGLAILIYTSGTTGMPKPAIAMPLYHSSAAILGLLNTLEAGKTIAIGRKFSATRFWDDVRAADASIIQYVGEMCRYLLKAPVQTEKDTGENLDKKHRVRTAFGNGLRPDVWAEFKERFGIDAIGEFYAATEAPLGTFNFSRNDFTMGAVGRNGWLYDAVMSFGGDAWFRTGDLVIWDKDGRVFFADRIGDTFRWKSENVSTAEVGQILGSHPAVHEANVYGVQLPHHDGRAGCAAIVVDGVDPSKVDLDTVYWLQDREYVPFREKDWKMIVEGAAKL
ncbi:unnamed protein product [Parascedosporium putredinis]|uniref:AMP-dependent synthetase/ligase domain-containing protein n=1 Tax=Parascedosporium putredinis TaxID=1442378 RepID=A0A9P1H206_9PEZI|nr:unnamed protein product [Parascedosporium putredinis]CAI7994300.1 unnamed protein product [Parascedosporium putredinis]